jgi:hypothetical protein
MAKNNYQKRLEALKKRRQDEVILEKSASVGQYKVLTESYELLKEESSIKYIIGAMNPVDKKSTDITLNEGERIKNQLSKLKEKGYDIDFKYQGSVTNNTHIKAHSDIDILTLHQGFISLEPPLKATSPYKGNPVQDLCELREACYALLKNAFPTASIDNEGAKSISLQGGSLRRKVDMVPSNWYDTVQYKNTGLEYYRGVMVLDYKEKIRIANTPFYHNKLLDDKDNYSSFNYKKVVRLLKTLKADADKKINLSSYDIAAIMYHMEQSRYLTSRSPLRLISNSLEYIRSLYEQDAIRNSLMVPDGSRKIFQEGGATKGDLALLIIELINIYEDILDDLKITGSSVNKEIIA